LSLSEWTRQWDASRVLVCDNFGTGAADVYVRRVLRPFHSLQDSLRLRLKTASGQYQKKPPRTPLAFRVDAVADGFREFGSAVLSSQRSHAEHDCSYGDRVLVAIPAGNTDRPADGKLAGRLASTPVDAPYAPMLKKRPMHSRASTAGQLNNTPVIAPYPLPRYVPEDTKSYAPDTGGLRDYAPMDTISDYAPRADTSGFR